MNGAWPDREFLAHPQSYSWQPQPVSTVRPGRRKPAFKPDLTTDKTALHCELEMLQRENARLTGRVEDLELNEKKFKSLLVRYEDLLLWLSRKYSFDFVPIM